MATSLEGGKDDGDETRAFGALTGAEEKHLIVAKVHLLAAARCRSEHLQSLAAAAKTQVNETIFHYEQSLEDLKENLDKAASKEVWADTETMREVLSIPEFSGYKAVVVRALEACPGAYDYISPDILEDAVLYVVEQCGSWLRHAPKYLQAERKVVLAAIASNAWALEFASDVLKADREVVLSAVRKHPSYAEAHQGSQDISDYFGVLYFASAALKNDKEVVLAALAADAGDLEYVSDDLKSDREVALAALRRQTPEDVKYFDMNMLEHVSEELLGDEEVVLEVARAGGDALQLASPELRKDKDFVLRATCRAPPEDREDFFRLGADDGIHQAIGLEDFMGATSSVLAAAGDTAPVLTITLDSARMPPEPNTITTSHCSFQSCEVTLLSGVSFTCTLSLAQPANTAEVAAATSGSSSPAGNNPPDLGRLDVQNEPQAKRPRLPAAAQPDREGPCRQLLPTVGALAEEVLEQLPKHVQMDPVPERIFLIFDKKRTDSDPIAVTPWDWNRPLSDFA